VKDLTAIEVAELEQAVTDFVQDRVLDGLDVIVIIQGRGQDRLAYPLEMVADAARILERAWLTACKRAMQLRN